MDLTPALVASLTGLLTGLSLIVAIGAQNTYLLQQGLLRQHVLAVVAVCTVSDLVLISAGVLGAGALLDRAPLVVTVARWAGAALLVGYAVLALRRAVRGQRLDVHGGPARPLGTVLVTALGLTWLNPHVYLDTVVLMGTVAAREGELRWWFAAGAMVASAIWFTALGLGSRALSRLLRSRRAWRVLDLAIAAVMLVTAVRLVLA
ncbi:L-lysine exporter family protein LysE/ArgO [Friedmanniella endophytica]|uniref:L-lysine exporter family protein LysE/ArgO n=1 Tax=Microlunatus kandeliicorticis TaxID=1759536 RepID=A0A7W3IRD7_9ACTN|nr:LysE/ArgO family amino acid transporter [Microlunatus kandeliicorticis]MBA8793837.1 L-lysine exporter family protein LysE/ArgO [Microlunatus kandeliicorticis]